MAPILFIYAGALSQIPNQVWGLLLITGCFQALYMWGLAAAYRYGDISIAYPIIRTLPIVFVACISVLINQGAALSAYAYLGMLMVIVGCLLIPLQSISSLGAYDFRAPAMRFALLSSFGVAGYTLADDYALSLLRSSEQVLLSVSEYTFVYLFFESLFASLILLLIILFDSKQRIKLWPDIKTNYRKGTLAGAAIGSTYFLVLVSMSYVDNVSYVIAFRQLSMPVAVLAGVYILKESKSRLKFIGTVAVFSGVLMLSLT